MGLGYFLTQPICYIEFNRKVGLLYTDTEGCRVLHTGKQGSRVYGIRWIKEAGLANLG